MLQEFKLSVNIRLLTVLCCWLMLNPVQAKTVNSVDSVSIISIDNLQLELRDSLETVHYAEQDSSKSKVLAAILAFPLGVFGLHRMYLGAKPIIPILYIVTFGGALGILPFIDMMVIILSKDTKPFYKNSKILMWYKKKSKNAPIQQ